MTNLMKSPIQSGMRNKLSPTWNHPLSRFFGNDLLNLWDNDLPMLTTPSMNIKEEKDQYKIELAAPGLRKEDFTIEVNQNVLTISSEKESESKDGKDNNGYERCEYNYSSFSRSVSLPDISDSSKIIAKYNDGVLTLTIPKKPEAQKNKSQKISIQ
jgi:HSP20 family protein